MPAVRDAWAGAYRLIATTMIEAAERPTTMVGRRAA